MSTGKKRALFCAAGVLLVLVLSLVMLDLQKPEQQGIWLSQRKSTDIERIDLADRKAGLNVSLRLTGGAWRVMPEEEVEEETITPLLAVLGYMKATDTIGNGREEAQKYGLDDPSLVIDVTYHGGEQTSYYLGEKISLKGSYLREEEGDTVYLIDEKRADILASAAVELTSLPLRQVEFEKVVGVYLNTGNGERISLNRSEAPRAEGDFFWTMSKPYASIARTQRVESIIRQIQEIGHAKKPQEQVSDEQAGFLLGETPSCTLYDSLDRELSIAMGEQIGEQVYVKINEGPVYLMDADVLHVLEIEPTALLDTTFYYFEVPTVAEGMLEWEGETYQLASVWKEGGAKRTQQFYVGDRQIAGGDYHEIAEMFETIQRTPQPIDQEGAVRRAGSFVVKRISQPFEQTITLWELEGQSDRIGVSYGNGILGTVARSDLDALAEKIRALKS